MKGTAWTELNAALQPTGVRKADTKNRSGHPRFELDAAGPAFLGRARASNEACARLSFAAVGVSAAGRTKQSRGRLDQF
jgi:hypothetical protein